jgi:site-specific DNA-methyltransferase (adenine-specific)
MPEPNFSNRTLFHGDNLDFLRGINTETVHLIATDPPFNKNRDFHATPNSLSKGASFTDKWRWEEDVCEEWGDAIKDNRPGAWAVIEAARIAAGKDMAAFLCWLGVRLLEMHRILREDGSLYLHIDHTAQAWVKCLLDSIFGRSNFRNEIVWYYKTGGVSKRWFGRKHDTILFYTKSGNYTFNPQQERSYLSHKYGFSNVTVHQDEQGYYTVVGARDVWDIPALRGNQPESMGYPTQKPLALYERIVKAGSNEGDIVLDLFCGCATTLIAAERLQRRWVGMDIGDGAHQMLLNRLAAEGLGVPEAADVQSGQQSLTFNHITYAVEPPVRTDDGIPIH